MNIPLIILGSFFLLAIVDHFLASTFKGAEKRIKNEEPAVIDNEQCCGGADEKCGCKEIKSEPEISEPKPEAKRAYPKRDKRKKQ